MVVAQEWRAQILNSRSEHRRQMRRLQRFAAINILRTRALFKATGRWVGTLLLCSHRGRGGPLGPLLSKYVAVGGCGTCAREGVWVRGHPQIGDVRAWLSHRFLTEEYPEWLESVGRLASRHDTVVAQREARMKRFSRALFKHEMEVTMSFLVRPVRCEMAAMMVCVVTFHRAAGACSWKHWPRQPRAS